MGANVHDGRRLDRSARRRSDDGKLEPIDMDFNLIPDAAMTIAVAALFADGTTTLRNIASWRVKETDRIAAMATELRKVGATVEEGADYLVVTPPAKLTPNAADRHLRRSPHGDVLLARRASAACRCASTIRNASARRFPIISSVSRRS